MFITTKEFSTLGANTGCLMKKNACIHLKFHAICNHQVYYLYYALKITKIYVKNNTSKNISSNEMKDIRIQFCKTPSKTFYETVFFLAAI